MKRSLAASVSGTGRVLARSCPAILIMTGCHPHDIRDPSLGVRIAPPYCLLLPHMVRFALDNFFLFSFQGASEAFRLPGFAGFPAAMRRIPLHIMPVIKPVVYYSLHGRKNCRFLSQYIGSSSSFGLIHLRKALIYLHQRESILLASLVLRCFPASPQSGRAFIQHFLRNWPSLHRSVCIIQEA